MANYRTICRRCRKWAIIGRDQVGWYPTARDVIRRLVDYRMNKHGGPITRIANWSFTQDAYRTLCDLVAITSPRVSLKRNVRFAWYEFIGRDRPSDMMRSTRIALDHYYRTGLIRGPKTSRFAMVLRGSDNVVVVDSWLARALSVPITKARNRTSQVLAEKVIGHVARAEKVALSDAQAMVWSGYIRTFYKNGKVPNYRTEDVGLYRTGVGGTLSDVPF